jgi:uncharacterized protein
MSMPELAKIPFPSGYEPIPLQEIITKVQSDCNLACPTCYVYAGADQSWHDKPGRMEEPVIARMAERVAEHAEAHDMPRVEFIYHGGEPLMNGDEYFRRAGSIIRSTMPTTTETLFYMQTNGVLLTDRMLDMIGEEDIRVGVSLNGIASVNDAMRPAKGGRGTHDIVSRNIRRLAERLPGNFSGLLCTIDPLSDPAETYEELARFSPPAIDFLIQHATWDSPPLHPAPATGVWLAKAFRHWSGQTDAQAPTVRLFISIIAGFLDKPSRSEQVGLSPIAAATVETDGSYELVDSLKIAYNGAPATGFNVFDDPLDTIMHLPEIRRRQIGMAGLSDTCQACPIVKVCGGGMFAHRHSSENGFNNPSAYCEDMKTLIYAVNDVFRAQYRR